MPRFEQEGFDPRRRRENDTLDRTVPEEDRHFDPGVDLDFNRRQRDVIDRQDMLSYVLKKAGEAEWSR